MVAFFILFFAIQGVFGGSDMHLVFQSTLSNPLTLFNRRVCGEDVTLTHQNTFGGQAKIVRFKERTFDDGTAFWKTINPYVKRGPIAQLFFERLGDEYTALSHVKRYIKPGGLVYIEPSINSRAIFYDSETSWRPDPDAVRYLMPTLTLFSDHPNVQDLHVGGLEIEAIICRLLKENNKEFQELSHEQAFHKIYTALSGSARELEEALKKLESVPVKGVPVIVRGVDPLALKEGVGRAAKDLRTLLEAGIVKASLQLGQERSDIQTELQNMPVENAVQNLWSFVLQNGYMHTRRDAIKKHIEQMGFENVTIECGKNPFNGRKNSWLIRAQKKQKGG